MTTRNDRTSSLSNGKSSTEKTLTVLPTELPKNSKEKAPFSSKPLESRIKEYERLKKKHPSRTPCIVTVAKNSKKLIPVLDMERFLVPNDSPLSSLLHVIRKRVKLQPDQALFMFAKNQLVPLNKLMADVHKEYKEVDNFIYFTLCSESTFGVDFSL